ncbi:UDP-glycosyltransferase 83A1-like isoform X2 [Tasmannia lanceolata]|uniref:UDP-glycosyltransferase 83A1-like isoform X2 n=1 Tax=Tasmannia lanceolata TaxID=3420 RepID=UPI0040634D15
MGKPHMLALPFPAQGHVIPLMSFSHQLADHGFKITFVNLDFHHARVMAALRDSPTDCEFVRLVSISDGLPMGEDRNELGKLSRAMFSVMPGNLAELIGKINESDDDKITCIIADESMGWAFDIADKMGIRKAAFWPAAAALNALKSHSPMLIEAGTIDDKGVPTKYEIIKLSPTMPEMNTAHFVWHCVGDLDTQQTIFQCMIQTNQAMKGVEWLLCNSFYELEPSSFDLVPKMLPIGPLLAGNRHGQPVGNFWPEDSTSLSWLDKHPPHSVIYVAFGSFTVFDHRQFHELALGLELSGRPFLWVVRPDLTGGPNRPTDAYPDGFLERVADRGRMVGWSPQQKVLAHTSLACFVTHCGWNSTMEGLTNGVPLLCWPYFADQFLNRSYISDVWKVGLGLNQDSDGIISKEEIKKKLEELLSDGGIRTRASELKEMAKKSVSEGGASSRNFNDFVEWIK